MIGNDNHYCKKKPDKNLSGFQCLCCGECCRWPGIVRVSEPECDAIAAYLEMELQAFLQKYTKIAPDRRGLILIDQKDGACVFLQKNNRCHIYSVRPRKCRTFPYEWDVPLEMQKRCAGRCKMREDIKKEAQEKAEGSVQGFFNDNIF
ncbi:MAG: YkgJ family cysteine cluster protein [Lentisphaeria bacterium]